MLGFTEKAVSMLSKLWLRQIVSYCKRIDADRVTKKMESTIEQCYAIKFCAKSFEQTNNMIPEANRGSALSDTPTTFASSKR